MSRLLPLAACVWLTLVPACGQRATPPGPPVPATPTPEQPDADPLAAEVLRHESAGDFAAALTAAEKRLAARKDERPADKKRTKDASEWVRLLQTVAATPNDGDELTAAKHRAAVAELADHHLSAGRYGAAEAILAAALPEVVAAETAEPPGANALFRRLDVGSANLKTKLSRVYRARGEYARAFPILRETLAAEWAFLLDQARRQTESERRRQITFFRRNLDLYLSVGLAAGVPAAELYAPVLEWKALGRRLDVAFREALAAARKVDPTADRLWTAYRSATEALAQAVADGSKTTAVRLALLNSRARQLDEAERALLVRLAAHWPPPRKVTVADVAAALPSDAAVVEYVGTTCREKPPGPNHLGTVDPTGVTMAFVVRSNGSVTLVNLGPTMAQGPVIQKWLNSLDRPAGAAAADARRVVWEPLVPHLTGVKTVLVAPDGLVTRAPLAALPGCTAGTLLIEERAVGTILSGAQLPAPARPSAASQLTLVGGVEYGEPNGQARGVWKHLPGTAAEVAAIEKIHADRRAADARVVLTGATATGSSLRAAAARTRFLHVATHGYSPEATDKVLEQSEARFRPSLLSGLVLAGANVRIPDADTGRLTAPEVSEFDLSGCELAVLSACETGLGAADTYDGLMSLQRSFHTAGARAVVSSLWKVPDRATEKLMVRFYRNLWERKLPKLEALREAQLWMLRDGAKDADVRRSLRGATADLPDEPEVKDARLPPRAWAAFQLSGDWR